ncbi:MAG: hypothetical protein QOE58_631 [Actinomycetota bacterium]|jgi:hypothetical protein|nr:hypothetical protein [Actinomycetota bacterium]
MPTNLTLMDRMRIESRVWTLDQQLYDLPHKRRIATRREVRSNLVSAAQNIGTRQALTNLGTSRHLAQEYLTAQYGPAPRPSWLGAGMFLLTTVLILTSILFDAAQAFADGLITASPHATGKFSWSGIGYLQSNVQYTLHDGRVEFVGGALTPLSYLLLALGAVAVGRLWRLLPGWRRSGAADE